MTYLLVLLFSFLTPNTQAFTLDKKHAIIRYKILYANEQGLTNLMELCREDCSRGVNRLGVGHLVDVVEKEGTLEVTPKPLEDKSQSTQ